VAAETGFLKWKIKNNPKKTEIRKINKIFVLLFIMENFNTFKFICQAFLSTLKFPQGLKKREKKILSFSH
jgi:hypothetical protein